MRFKTRNRIYELTDLGDGAFSMSGHPIWCPTPTPVQIGALPEVGRVLWFTALAGAWANEDAHTSTVTEIL